MIRTFGVATAKPGYTTPEGDWKVTRKAVNPTWYNPALDSWGADLPAVVPGGPTAPMGTRAIYIDEAPGLIRIHGTPSDDSIGRYASHGCIRMHNSEIEQLYPMVPVGRPRHHRRNPARRRCGMGHPGHGRHLVRRRFLSHFRARRGCASSLVRDTFSSYPVATRRATGAPLRGTSVCRLGAGSGRRSRPGCLEMTRV